MSASNILMLHRVRPEYDADNYYFEMGTAISWNRFVSLLEQIEEKKIEALPISKLCSARENAVYITFDDGYSDNFLAVQELKKRGMSATIFPVKNFVKQKFSPIDDMACHLNNNFYAAPDDLKESLITGRIKSLLKDMRPSRYRRLRKSLFNISCDAQNPFMSEAQLQECVELGMELGVHGVTHRTFPSLTLSALRGEVEEACGWITNMGQSGNPALCLPHGRFNDSVVDLLTEYFEVILSVDKSISNPLVYRRQWIVEDQVAVL